MEVKVRCLCGNLYSEGVVSEKGVVYVSGTKVKVEQLELDYVRIVTPERQVIDLDLMEAEQKLSKGMASGSVFYMWKI